MEISPLWRSTMIRREMSSCVVLSGTLVDPYTGSVVPFLRGADTSEDVQVDHVVPLADAWQSGAQQLTAQQRQDFGNDPIDLQATIGWVNQQKGAGDSATWLPPDKSYRCTYVAWQITVKVAYRLWVKPAEKEPISRILEGCGPIPSTMTADWPTHSGTILPTAGSPDPTPLIGTGTGTAAVMSESFQSCAAARVAGAAPVHSGDPGYSPKLDGDQDGIACQ